MNRLKAACRTNTPQVVSVLMFTAANLFVFADCGLWLGLLAAGITWPVAAFASNLVWPMPE